MKLKPCPFCASRVQISEAVFAGFKAICTNTHCFAVIYGSTPEEVAESWNRRPSPAKSPATPTTKKRKRS